MIDFAPSYYEASAARPAAAYPPLAGEASADVCIVGGGFTGLSCALELARRGMTVLLAEAEAVGWGASGRSGGQMIAGYSTAKLAPVARRMGISEKEVFAFSLEALDLLRGRIREFSISCDLRSGHAIAIVKKRDIAEERAWMEKLEKEFNYSSLRFYNAARFREIVASRRYAGGIVDSNGGHLHPLKYVLGLAAAASAAGATICEQTPVEKVRRENGKITVSVAGGRTVRCRQLVYACNAYGGDLLPGRIAARCMPVGTYIGATAPLPPGEAENLIAGGLAVADTNFVLDYYRCSADGRLLFGGRAHYSRRPPADLKKTMHTRMRRVFPQLSDAAMEYAWGGYVGISASRFPDIGRAERDVYYAQGFSGQGVALTGFAGKIIAEAVAGEAERLDLFSRVRHLPFVGGRLFRTPLLVLAMFYYRMRDLL